MATNFRRTKLERFVKRLEAKLELTQEASFGSAGYGKHEAFKEVIVDLKHEFNLKEDKPNE